MDGDRPREFDFSTWSVLVFWGRGLGLGLPFDVTLDTHLHRHGSLDLGVYYTQLMINVSCLPTPFYRLLRRFHGGFSRISGLLLGESFRRGWF